MNYLLVNCLLPPTLFTEWMHFWFSIGNIKVPSFHSELTPLSSQETIIKIKKHCTRKRNLRALKTGVVHIQGVAEANKTVIATPSPSDGIFGPRFLVCL